MRVNSNGVHFLSAMSAGVVTSTITSPIWVVKTQMQLDNRSITHVNVLDRSITHVNVLDRSIIHVNVLDRSIIHVNVLVSTMTVYVNCLHLTADLFLYVTF